MSANAEEAKIEEVKNEEVANAQNSQIIKVDSAQGLEDGSINSMPATCVDELFARRSVKRVGSHRPGVVPI